MGLLKKEYSVLMSVYARERPGFLAQSMESIWGQTVPTDDLVLVCDGPLTEGLDRVIGQMEEAHPKELQVVRLKENRGLGRALNIGLRRCRHALVARMDSDDISRPERCEKELRIMEEEKGIDIVGGTVEEFREDPARVCSRRVLPENWDEIWSFARKRNPFNHPTVMFRKDKVLEAGGYQDFYLLEDYHLWIRMFLAGCRGRNLPEPLVWMRTGDPMFRRRGGWRYAKAQVRLFRYMWSSGYITAPEFFGSAAVRVGGTLLPSGIRKELYEKMLRTGPP